MMQITLADGDVITINLLQLVFHKAHPSVKKPQYGILVMSNGRELFVDIPEYGRIKEKLNGIDLPQAIRSN